MKAHLDAVGLIDLVTGVFFTNLGVLVSLGVLLFAPIFYGAPPWKPADEASVVAVILFVSGVFVAIGIPPLIAGIGLWKQKRWARTRAIVVAVLALASFSVGTAAGLYALWVLTHQETEQLPGEVASQEGSVLWKVRTCGQEDASPPKVWFETAKG